MEQLPLAIGGACTDLESQSNQLNELFDHCDDILGNDEYAHDLILHSFVDLLDCAAMLDKHGQLSEPEMADCLASTMLLRDAICTLLGVRERLVDRVNKLCRPFTPWKHRKSS